jgi:hypothetical protein
MRQNIEQSRPVSLKKQRNLKIQAYEILKQIDKQTNKQNKQSTVRDSLWLDVSKDCCSLYRRFVLRNKNLF